MREEFASPHPWSGVEIRDPDFLTYVVPAEWPEPEFPFDPEEFLQYLGDFDAEIAWLVIVKRKSQADAGALLGRSQSAVSARLIRVGRKIRYLADLSALDPEETVEAMSFLRERHRAILLDLAFSQHQSATGRRHGVTQSTVRGVALEARRRAAALAEEDPDRWRRAHLLCELVFRNLGLRVR